MSDIQSSFMFNDSIIRSLFLSRNKAEADVSALSKQTEDESEYLKENDKTRESQSKSLDTKTKEEETPVKESSEESIKTEIESSQE